MLSIGKLAVGQAKYYLDQAQGRVDAIDSVVGGAEDYYAGSGEAQGVWLGAGARELGLGLERAVAGAELRTILAGADPRTDASLRQATSPVRVAAYDLTFSAPKSVSVVFGIGDHELSGAVRGAHDRAGHGSRKRSGAAKESNLPTAGLRRPAGFEDRGVGRRIWL